MGGVGLGSVHSPWARLGHVSGGGARAPSPGCRRQRDSVLCSGSGRACVCSRWSSAAPEAGSTAPFASNPGAGGGPAPRSRAVCSPPHPGPRHLPHRTAGQREPSTARARRLGQGSWANPPCHTGRRKKEKLSQEEHRLRLQTCAALGDLRSGPAHVQREGLAAPMAGVRLGGYTPRPFPTLGGCGAGHGPGPPEAEQDLTRGRGLQTSLSSDFPGGRSWPVW